MGTSGAYGGSGGHAWSKVRELLEQLPVVASDEGVADADTNDSGDGQDGDAAPLVGLGGALADALAGDDSALSSQPEFNLPDLLPRRSSGGGGARGGGGGGIRGESGLMGRTGGSSRRSVARSAARGGAAIGGAYALRSGNREALAGIGLDLDELRTLGPRSQCARILEAVLGEGGHPDEMALRVAAAEQLRAVIVAETPPTEAEALRGFVAAFVFQMSLVELRAQLAKEVINVAAATRQEGRLRRYIEKRVSTLKIPTSGTMSIADFSRQANRLVRETIGLLRAR